MKCTIKPIDNIQFYMCCLFFILPIIFDFGFIATYLNGVFDKQLFIACIIMTSLPVLGYIVARLFCPYKYVIDDYYLTKYKFKKILFKIKKEDIIYIGIRKKVKFSFIKFIIAAIIFDNESHIFNSISFIYDTCEVSTDYQCGDFKRHSFLENKVLREPLKIPEDIE